MSSRTPPASWYRVFGLNGDPPPLEDLVDDVRSCLRKGNFLNHLSARGDDQGWYQVALEFKKGPPLTLQRYLSTEEGMRAELNTWAAWLEIHAPQPQRWMQHLIETKQVIVFQSDPKATNALAQGLCRWLAAQTKGIYQIDDLGFFTAAGALVVAEAKSV